MDITTEDSRIYAKDENGTVIAEITFPTKDGVASIDHTPVDEFLRGQGIAGQLMNATVSNIQKDGNKNRHLLCSYS